MTNKKRMEMDEVNKTVQSIEDLKKIDNKDELIKNMTLTYSKLSKISPAGIEKMISYILDNVKISEEESLTDKFEELLVMFLEVSSSK